MHLAKSVHQKLRIALQDAQFGKRISKRQISPRVMPSNIGHRFQERRLQEGIARWSIWANTGIY